MILFLDTVSPLPKFSIIKDNKIVKSIHILDKNSNKISDSLITKFLKLKQVLIKNDKINKLIVCNGPGSYTALRIGIAFMYGLSITQNIPLIGISAIDILNMIISKNKKNKTLILLFSSNNQNFICKYSIKKNKYLIKKFNKISENNINEYKDYIYCVSNNKVPKQIKERLVLKDSYEEDFSNIINLNIDKIKLWKNNEIIEPIYISDNKILN